MSESEPESESEIERERERERQRETGGDIIGPGVLAPKPLASKQAS